MLQGYALHQQCDRILKLIRPCAGRHLFEGYLVSLKIQQCIFGVNDDRGWGHIKENRSSFVDLDGKRHVFIKDVKENSQACIQEEHTMQCLNNVHF